MSLSQTLPPQAGPHPVFTLCMDTTLYEALKSNHVTSLKPHTSGLPHAWYITEAGLSFKSDLYSVCWVLFALGSCFSGVIFYKLADLLAGRRFAQPDLCFKYKQGLENTFLNTTTDS